jgi:propanediol dehydratase small subunit
VLSPHHIVREAAWAARGLADTARRVGDPERAQYFDRVAAETTARADRLLALEQQLRQRRGGPSALKL